MTKRWLCRYRIDGWCMHPQSVQVGTFTGQAACWWSKCAEIPDEDCFRGAGLTAMNTWLWEGGEGQWDQ